MRKDQVTRPESAPSPEPEPETVKKPKVETVSVGAETDRAAPPPEWLFSPEPLPETPKPEEKTPPLSPEDIAASAENLSLLVVWSFHRLSESTGWAGWEVDDTERQACVTLISTLLPKIPVKNLPMLIAALFIGAVLLTKTAGYMKFKKETEPKK